MDDAKTWRTFSKHCDRLWSACPLITPCWWWIAPTRVWLPTDKPRKRPGPVSTIFSKWSCTEKNDEEKWHPPWKRSTLVLSRSVLGDPKTTTRVQHRGKSADSAQQIPLPLSCLYSVPPSLRRANSPFWHRPVSRCVPGNSRVRYFLIPNVIFYTGERRTSVTLSPQLHIYVTTTQALKTLAFLILSLSLLLFLFRFFFTFLVYRQYVNTPCWFSVILLIWPGVGHCFQCLSCCCDPTAKDLEFLLDCLVTSVWGSSSCRLGTGLGWVNTAARLSLCYFLFCFC